MRHFQEHQATARRKTFRLFFWMGVMQLLTTVLIGTVFGYLYAVWMELNNWERLDEVTSQFLPWMLTGGAFAMVLAATGIGLAAWWKYNELKDGGRKIAEMLSAKRIGQNTPNRKQRQLLNIVEEIAIASRIPVPPVFIMESETGINALAAGHRPADAVIVVTGGACKRLTRDQMQGVIAHEFAHILNGDIGRNMLLMAMTYGNYAVLFAAQGMINADSSGYSDDDLGAGPFNWIIGFILWPLGLFGASIAMLFMALIKRQGEFNADATAVEFTRLPDGLSEALKMIGGNDAKGRVRRAGALEASHLFFADNGSSITRWFDPHPPLDQRIIRLCPDWDGSYLYESEEELGEYGDVYDEVVDLVGAAKTASRQSGKTQRVENMMQTMNQFAAPVLAATAADSGGQQPVCEEELETDVPEWVCTAPAFEVDINPAFLEVAGEPTGAALVLAAIRVGQFEQSRADELIAAIDPMIRGQFLQVKAAVETMDQTQRITMFDCAYQSIAKLSGPARLLFTQFAKQSSVPVDQESSVSRWAWQMLVQRKLSGSNSGKKPNAKFGRLSDVLLETVMLVSHVIHTDCDNDAAGNYTYIRATSHTGLAGTQILSREDCTLEGLEFALGRLRLVAAAEKRKLLVACGACVTSNREINLEEAWIMRAVCAGLGYPLPKLVPGQPVTPGA